MSELDDFFVHTVTLTPKTGDSGYGPTFGTPTDVACFVDDTVQLVRAPDGEQVVSSSTVYAPPGAPDGPPGSTITFPDGRVSTVITQARRTSGPLDLPDHVAWTVT
ncbi:hypothetical protein GCM10025864_44480 [Luteimicrobium album]|uniref:Uncharacterized protein n=1 Tax=Luteimicrobium album TaxID=1054550 RepID=A0ABQ6IAG8_9MICO|nr:hypothetical protein [Luteimicrobium album]GMA22283.1 hypothetical protein GCM10025864_00420 [Luteimicrobium album]GMA26689.1 hypothetical protein GCM10025864_44480 [Luteimicrobium album]